MNRRRGTSHPWAVICVWLLALTACASPATTTPPADQSSAPICVSSQCAATSVRLFVEPDAGEAPVLQAIRSARASIWVEVYLLSDRNIVHALQDAAGRGLDVRVLLEPHPYGGGDVPAQVTLDALNASGAQARPASPSFHYTHAKLLLIDGATLYVLTCNLSRAGLGGNGATANRDYGIIDTDPQDVAAARHLFLADWSHTSYTHTDPRLVVSPINSRATLTALIAGATSTLWIEAEEMYDRASEDLLIAAAHRGVEVRLTLPAPSDTSDASPDIPRLIAGGVHVRYLRAPYLHAKLIIADGALAFVGSQNFSATSLDENREVGLIVSAPQVLATLRYISAQDWATADDAA